MVSGEYEGTLTSDKIFEIIRSIRHTDREDCA